MRQDESLIDYMLRRNREQVAQYRQTSTYRRKYRRDYPTELVAAKCSDGRVHIPTMANIPVGIIQPYRNIGADFDFGWPNFYQNINGWVDYVLAHHRYGAFLSVYHWSEGDKHRGCRGQGYNKNGAFASAERLVGQFEDLYGRGHEVIYPIVLGLETDSDGFIFHGMGDQTLDVRTLSQASAEELFDEFRRLYPDMNLKVIPDLARLAMGNCEHVDQIRRMKRQPDETGHKEQILVVGQGAHWIHEPNRALIVGPFSPNVDEPIATAAQQLYENLQSDRLNDVDKGKGILIMTSAFYRDSGGPERQHAIFKSRALAEIARRAIEQNVPELKGYLHTLNGITYAQDLTFTELK